MPQLANTIDPNAIDYAAVERNILPEGAYNAKIVESDEGPTKSGTGRKIDFTWEVIDGQAAGRKFWQTINYINNNPTAQSIGQAMLGRIAQACGHNQAVQSTDSLHGIPCRVHLKVQKQEGYNDRNEVKKVERYGNPGGAPQGAMQQPQAQQAPTAPQPQQAPPAQGYQAPPQTSQNPNGPWPGPQATGTDDIPFG